MSICRATFDRPAMTDAPPFSRTDIAIVARMPAGIARRLPIQRERSLA